MGGGGVFRAVLVFLYTPTPHKKFTKNRPNLNYKRYSMAKWIKILNGDKSSEYLLINSDDITWVAQRTIICPKTGRLINGTELFTCSKTYRFFKLCFKTSKFCGSYFTSANSMDEIQRLLNE